MAITTTHKLLTGSWNADVHSLETAIGRLGTGGLRTNDCQVTFFEIAGDAHLHVNVQHKYQTATARGWSGPASLPSGFVHNRRFDDMDPSQMIRHIREMVFATRHQAQHGDG